MLVARPERGFQVIIVRRSDLFPDRTEYHDGYDQRRQDVARSNAQAVSDAKAAVRDVVSYYRSIGVRPEEGATDIDVAFDPTFPNAAYDPSRDRMIIGVDPRTDQSFATSSPDVVAHELGHRIAAGTGVLGRGSDTNGENGAVQEHVADVFAAAYDSSNWTIGEVDGFQSIRDMANPNSLGHPATVAQYDYLMRERGGAGVVVRQRDERGREHASINWHNVAEIPNRAAVQIAEVTGRDGLAKVYLDAMRHRIGPSAGLGELAMGVTESAAAIYGEDSRAHRTAQQAFEAVGLLERA